MEICLYAPHAEDHPEAPAESLLGFAPGYYGRVVATVVTTSPIPLRLQREQMRVMPVLGHQLHVVAAFDDAAVLDHDDLVGHAHGGEAVRDQDRDAAAGEFAEVFEDGGFGLRVHRGGGFVQHQDVGA